MTDAAGEPASGSSLQVRGRPRLVLLAWLIVLGLIAAVLGWFSTHPEELPTTDSRVTASTPAGQPVFVGVFRPADGFHRELRLSGVKIFATSTVTAEITPHLCVGGGVAVTSDPLAFCDEVVGTEGTTMRAGDEIILEVNGVEPGTVLIDRIRVAYRDGVQWGTQDAGAPALVTLLPR